MKTRFFTCTSDECHQSFRDKEAFERHVLDHGGLSQENSKIFFCSICDRSLATKQSLKEHRFIHLKKKNFRCSEIGCGKLFRQNSQLCNHRKVHKEAKKILCQKNITVIKRDAKDDRMKLLDGERIPDCFFNEAQQITLPPIRNSYEGITLPNLPDFSSYV